MGKRTTGRAKGKGSLTFQIRKRAYVFRIGYPKIETAGNGKIIKLVNSLAHSCPLAKIQIGNEFFYSPAADGVYEGQEIEICGKNAEKGNVMKLKDIPQGTKIFNVEKFPGSGGKILRSSGTSGFVMNKDKNKVEVIIKRRKIILNENCRATVGVASGDGRVLKPIVKAGKKHHMMLSKGRKWHRTSPIKTNALDHPFGGGRGKRIKSKIAKRNAPPGAKVGHIRPRRTGRKK
ncbi:MAG: 50S ribosomal protein L2 [Candidatus Pacearchaeota archaeon]|jgi:large subunit ribosomal protein L2